MAAPPRDPRPLQPAMASAQSKATKTAPFMSPPVGKVPESIDAKKLRPD